MKTESMKITFGGQSHQIDSNTLINTLIHYNAIVAEANREISGGTRNIRVNINALKEGSFEINMSLAEKISGLFSGETVAYLAGLVTITSGAFRLYKKFKGKPIDSNANTEIKGDHNIVQNTINVYNNRIVREAISKSIETANEDINVENITISGEKIDSVIFEKGEFPSLIYTDFDTEENRPQEKDEYVDASLIIIGLKFEKGGKWEFIYEGFKIGMTVKDDALMRAIDSGARFGKGDAIKVKMKIIKRFNPVYNAYENKGYKIVEFYDHIINSRPTQGSLFSNPSEE